MIIIRTNKWEGINMETLKKEELITMLNDLEKNTLNKTKELRYDSDDKDQLEEFNEVDAIIFSLLSYANLLDIVPESKKEKILLKDASTLFSKKYIKICLSSTVIHIT